MSGAFLPEGLTPSVLLSTWHLHPFTPESDFLVAVLTP